MQTKQNKTKTTPLFPEKKSNLNLYLLVKMPFNSTFLAVTIKREYKSLFRKAGHFILDFNVMDYTLRIETSKFDGLFAIQLQIKCRLC